MKPPLTHLKSTTYAVGITLLMLMGSTQAQQFPNPTTAAEVSGPAAGNTMTKEYVQMVGRMAYFWGWPLVANANRAVAFSKAPEPGLIGGLVPIAYGGIAMLTDYVTADQRVIACSNQDVVYGPGFLPLGKEPYVFQVPDFGSRFWVFALYDARTDEFSQLGQQYGTKPGFYLVVGPDWKGETPSGITAVVRSSTALAFAVPRVAYRCKTSLRPARHRNRKCLRGNCFPRCARGGSDCRISFAISRSIPRRRILPIFGRGSMRCWSDLKSRSKRRLPVRTRQVFRHARTRIQFACSVHFVACRRNW